MTEVGIIPLGDRVLVEVVKIEERTKGGIILPPEYRDKREMAQLEAVVIANGETADQKLDIWPEPGDRVVITKYAGVIYQREDQEFRIVNADDIIAILKEAKDGN